MTEKSEKQIVKDEGHPENSRKKTPKSKNEIGTPPKRKPKSEKEPGNSKKLKAKTEKLISKSEVKTLNDEQLIVSEETLVLVEKESPDLLVNEPQQSIEANNEQVLVIETEPVEIVEEAKSPKRKAKSKRVVAISPMIAISDTSLEDMNSDHNGHEEEDDEKFDDYTKEQLVELLENIVGEEDVNAIKNKVAKIKVAFWKNDKEEKLRQIEKYIASGGKRDEYTAPEDKLEIRYNAAFNIYKEKKAKFLEEQEKEKQDNLQKKLRILEELKVLIGSEETLKKTYDDFKALQERWKSIGQVPRTEVNNLWQNYHFLVENFFDKVKINNELKELDLKKNFEKQLALCEKAEELLLEPSILKSFKQLQQYHEDWKEIGPVPAEKKDELWKRFKSATDRINQLRHEYYSKLQEEQEKNYIAKSALCEQAEQINISVQKVSSAGYQGASLRTSKSEPQTHNSQPITHQWQEAGEQISEIQKMWKTIGYTPRKNNNEVWERFRNAINTFYNNRSEYFNKIKEDQTNNYNQKIALCIQAEALQESQEWKTTTTEFINLQNEWKKIGPVPFKYSNKIWNRFRKACDVFFRNREIYFSSLDKNQEENFNLKLDIIKKIKELEPGQDNNENLNKLKELQSQWMNIGHVPSESMDKIYSDFKAAVNEQFEKLKMHSPDKIDYRAKAKIDELLSKPNADRIIFKETSFLTTKISTLKNDIKLWENNMGFLANSKNADILKEEFTKKINSAKEQVVQLQEKFKLYTEAKKNLKK